MLLRAPYWHLAHRFFVATLLWCCVGGVFAGGSAPVHPILFFLGLIAEGLAAG